MGVTKRVMALMLAPMPHVGTLMPILVHYMSAVVKRSLEICVVRRMVVVERMSAKALSA